MDQPQSIRNKQEESQFFIVEIHFQLLKEIVMVKSLTNKVRLCEERTMGFIKKIFAGKSKTDWDEVRRSLESKIAGAKRSAIRLLKSEESKSSKFGGLPFVEGRSFKWPESSGKPMAFIAQLDLAEIAQVHKYDWLGKKGVVLFFYDVIEMPWGFDPKDRGSWQVIFQASPDTYHDFPDEFDDESKIKEQYITPKLVEILPNYDDPIIEKLELTDEETDLYIDLDEVDEEPMHQIGGFPSPVQGNHMELESQLASNGIYVGTPEGNTSEETKQLESGAKDWKLLFQFDSDNDLDIMWGDCGMIYFWVQQQKSKLDQFDNCWLILQCC